MAVISSREHKQPKLPRCQRLWLAALGSGLLAMLILAGLLRPDCRGYGTHQQLGLPACTFNRVFGYRCPSCGMTTSWAHLVRGRVIRAVRANAGGTLLGVIAMIAGPWALVSGCYGRWVVRLPSQWTAVTLAIAIVLITLIDWSIRLYWIWQNV